MVVSNKVTGHLDWQVFAWIWQVFVLDQEPKKKLVFKEKNIIYELLVKDILLGFI